MTERVQGEFHMGVLRRIIWWDFERASWQWDVLCLLIVFFIFLTPKSWFGRGPGIAEEPKRIIFKDSKIGRDAANLESRLRELTGNPNLQVEHHQVKTDMSGETYFDVVTK